MLHLQPAMSSTPSSLSSIALNPSSSNQDPISVIDLRTPLTSKATRKHCTGEHSPSVEGFAPTALSQRAQRSHRLCVIVPSKKKKNQSAEEDTMRKLNRAGHSTGLCPSNTFAPLIIAPNWLVGFHRMFVSHRTFQGLKESIGSLPKNRISDSSRNVQCRQPWQDRSCRRA